MQTSVTNLDSQVVESMEKSLRTFCNDISGMFDIDIVCNQQEVVSETVERLEKRFKNLASVSMIKAQGVLNGNLRFIFDQQGLFILAGIITMQPEQMIQKNIKLGSLKEAENMSSTITDLAIALVGACQRVFRSEFNDPDCLAHTDTFVGNPWEKSQEKIGLANNEELILVSYEIKVGSYPAFNCGVVFPETIFGSQPPTTLKQTNPADAQDNTKIIEGNIEAEGAKTPAEQGLTDKDRQADIIKENNLVEENVNTSSDTGESEGHPVSEAIQKMAESHAASTPSAILARDIMRKDILWARSDDSVQQALARIQQHSADYMMVGQDGILEGIVSKSDLTGATSPFLRPEFARWRRPLDEATLKIKIKWIMKSPVDTIGLEIPFAEIMQKMCQSGRRALPVIDRQGKVQGLITARDIFKVLIEHSRHR